MDVIISILISSVVAIFGGMDWFKVYTAISISLELYKRYRILMIKLRRRKSTSD